MLYEYENKNHLFKFDSFTELTEEVGKKWGSDPMTTCGLNMSGWIGRTFSAYKDVVNAINKPWQQGMNTYEKFKQLLSDCKIPAPKNIRRRTAWSEDNGDELCLDRLRTLQPYWRTTKRDARPGPINVSILVDVSTSAIVSAVNSTWRCVACAFLLELLEEAGYRVEVMAVEQVLRNYTNRDHFSASVCLKQCQEPLDIVSIINCVSPWSYRIIFFGARALANKKSQYGLGTIIPTNKKLFTTNEQTIVLYNVFDQISAQKWVLEQLKKIETGELLLSNSQ